MSKFIPPQDPNDNNNDENQPQDSNNNNDKNEPQDPNNDGNDENQSKHLPPAKAPQDDFLFSWVQFIFSHYAAF